MQFITVTSKPRLHAAESEGNSHLNYLLNYLDPSLCMNSNMKLKKNVFKIITKDVLGPKTCLGAFKQKNN